MNHRIGIAIFSLLTVILLASCEQQGPAERAGEKIDEGLEETGERVEETTEEAAEEIEEAADALREKASD